MLDNSTTTSEFSTEVVANASNYHWLLQPENVGTISGDGLTGTVEWNMDFMGMALICSSRKLMWLR